MTDRELALRYAPIVHFDRLETIPLRAVGYTVFRKTAPSVSFPGRSVPLPEGAAFTIEYAYYFDYDIQHMYDLEHIWVTIDGEGRLVHAEASFHGKYLILLVPGLHGALPPTDERVHAFCQPGKHAFLPVGELFRIVPGWDTSCNSAAGGAVLIGNPFSAAHSPTGKDLFVPTAADDAHSARWIREHLTFSPSLDFSGEAPSDVEYMPWEALYARIPEWIAAECARLNGVYGQ